MFIRVDFKIRPLLSSKLKTAVRTVIIAEAIITASSIDLLK